uniref:Allophycocyanin gamma subunit n=1 Tax=Cyanoptyche gloeocystis TaxID=77922 RepID=A0A3G1IWJ9_9EUKA|nr:allophycocyanin gamma subunit [Cyanoptyche gloeocystis]|mmetsp:Transcript_15008/g.25685  ORF Transcript_15008/g.25685 Transcript_15008/m.25685 type:complete len:162 (-) Transcript_15008:1041-1526(-)
MSLITQIIQTADDDLRYPTSGELKTITEYLKTGENRLRIAAILAQNEKKIIEQSSFKLFQKCPEFVSPGGNAYGARQKALCLRDFGWYLRVITYGIITGNIEPIDKIGIIGVREMYNSLGVPVKGMVDAITFLKENALNTLNKEDASTVEQYFDYLIQSLY